MADPFVAMFDAILATDLAMRVDYQSPVGGFVLDIPALHRRPDVVGELGVVRVSQDIRVWEIRVSDLAGMIVDPKAGDYIRSAGSVTGDAWRVQSDPVKDEESIFWIMEAYKELPET